MTSAEDNETLMNLMNYLQKRIVLRNSLLREQNQKGMLIFHVSLIAESMDSQSYL